MTETIIHVATVLGKFKATSEEDGQMIYDLIMKAFLDKKKVVLAFDNMEVLSEDFLKTAIGQLYENFSHDDIKENMIIDNILLSGKIALKRVVDQAKKNS